MRFKGTLVLLIACLALGSFIYFFEIKGGKQREKEEQAEKQFWKLEAKDIRQIDLISSNQHISAARKGETDWVITAPRSLDADSEEFSRLASSASSLQRDSVLDPDVSDPARFGLSPARFSLKLKTKEGKEYGIDFGNNNPTGNSTYAAIPGSKAVYLVSAAAASALDKKLDDLRNHTVLSFDQPEAQSLNLKSSKGDLHLVKDGNDRWWIEGTHRVAADSPLVRGILNALSLGRIKEFLAGEAADYTNLGLEKALVEASVTYGKNKAIKRLVIGSPKSAIVKKGGKELAQEGTQAEASGAEPSSSQLYLAKDESRADLFFVDKDVVDKLLKTADDLRDKALASFQRWDIDSINLSNSKGNFDFHKRGGEWFLGDKGKKAKWDAVNGILDAMEKPVKKLIDSPSAFSAYGLDKPAIRVVLKQGNAVTVECTLGKAAKDGVYAQLKGDPSVKVADPESYEKLDKSEADLTEPPAAAAVPKK